ncbi:hypothetical protein [Sphingomonas sp. OK281]|uniref:hypothetical protein n=1 Tax=Sphingomonas sp. OK281 TaxID=1881067 RepID=UPI0008F3D79E|nr:hypothetical protein [Sphingomonas sp. OK281]SFO15985.1 hypothetical protein SAMN05428984_2393 [Sphingomonas sp. OK281]
MISLVLMLALQAAAPSATPSAAANPGPGPITAIGKQKLPAKGCAAYLWSMDAGRQLVAMAMADPAQIRLAIDGKTTDYAMATQSPGIGFGFGGVTQYRGGDVTATLDMAIAVRADISAGATVTSATLRIDRPGRDTVVMPVGGLIGCV